MNKQDNENINTSLLQGEVSPQAIILPTGGIIRPTGGLTGIIPPTGGITGILPPTGIIPTGIRPTGILPTGILNQYYQPTPFKKFQYKPLNGFTYNTYEWQYNGQRVLKAYIKDDNIQPTLLGKGTVFQEIAEKNKGRYFYVYSPEWTVTNSFVTGIHYGSNPIQTYHWNNGIWGKMSFDCGLDVNFYSQNFDNRNSYKYSIASPIRLLSNQNLPYNITHITITGTTYCPYWIGELDNPSQYIYQYEPDEESFSLTWAAEIDINDEATAPDKAILALQTMQGAFWKIACRTAETPYFFDNSFSDYNTYVLALSQRDYNTYWNMYLNKTTNKDVYIRTDSYLFPIKYSFSHSYSQDTEDEAKNQLYAGWNLFEGFPSVIYGSQCMSLAEARLIPTHGSSATTKNTYIREGSPVTWCAGLNRLMALGTGPATMYTNYFSYTVYNNNTVPITMHCLTSMPGYILDSQHEHSWLYDYILKTNFPSSEGFAFKTVIVPEYGTYTVNCFFSGVCNTRDPSHGIVFWWNPNPNATTFNENSLHTQYVFVDFRTKSSGYNSLYSTYRYTNWAPVSSALMLPFNQIGKTLSDYMYGGYSTIKYMTGVTGLDLINPIITLEWSKGQPLFVSIRNSNSYYGIWVLMALYDASNSTFKSDKIWSRAIGAGRTSKDISFKISSSLPSSVVLRVWYGALGAPSYLSKSKNISIPKAV